MRIAVGAVYQTVTCCVAQDRYQRSASKSLLVDDARDAVGERRDDAVGDAGHPARDRLCTRKCRPGCRSSAYRAVAWCATTASCTCTAPFGVPVVPLVKCSSARCLGRSVGADLDSASEAVSMRRGEATVPGRAHPRPACRRSAAPCSRPGSAVAHGRRSCAGTGSRVVTRHVAVARCSSRCAIGSGPKAEKSGQNTRPRLSVPRTADVELGNPAGQRRRPVSPLPTPRDCQDVGEAVRRAHRARHR